MLNIDHVNKIGVDTRLLKKQRSKCKQLLRRPYIAADVFADF